MATRGTPAGHSRDPRADSSRGESANARAALDHVFSAAYEELRRLAASVRRRDQLWVQFARSDLALAYDSLGRADDAARVRADSTAMAPQR
ncbi:MAG TPA: hypothetical protein VFZ21_10835 [Gemmatimonadaceae bacterium]|jgi:hypothetical protein|nr:hypothetical protein [Gemmatimonadaceae bacterium]